MIPLMPSPIVSRASAAVGATSAMRQPGFSRATDLIHSAPAIVLPAPRPPRKSHVDQPPRGGSWLGRAIASQHHRNPSVPSWPRMRATFSAPTRFTARARSDVSTTACEPDDAGADGPLFRDDIGILAGEPPEHFERGLGRRFR